MDEANRARLAQHMEDRLDELGLTWDQAAARGSTTAETFRQVRKFRRDISRKTRRAIEVAFDWRAGSVRAILLGGEPQAIDAAGDGLQHEADDWIDPERDQGEEMILGSDATTAQKKMMLERYHRKLEASKRAALEDLQEQLELLQQREDTG